MAEPVRDEVEAEEDALLVLIDLLCVHRGDLLVFGHLARRSKRVDEPDGRELGALDAPLAEVLVAASYEVGVVVWVELDAEDGKVASVAVSDGATLLSM